MAAEYELILMLDPELADARREEIAGNTRGRIDSGGTLRHSDGWGVRKLAYEVRQRNEADYRFFRFECEPALLEDLEHTLKITDGILRFRVFKVDPRSPLIEPPAAPQLGARRDERGGRGRDRGEDRSEQPEEAPASESPQAAAPPEPAESAAPAAEPEPVER